VSISKKEKTGILFYGKEVMSAAPVSSSNVATPDSFQQALEIYKTSYVQYRATGNAAYKKQYEDADQYIQGSLASLNQQISNDATRITNFLSEYATANPELAALQSKFQTIRKEGPAVQDKYATIRRVQSETPPVDMTTQYVKVGLIVALMGLVVVFSR
jgi:hypothetical protein